ncbi:4Fe-4S binding protein [Clostridium sp. SHJSY1]|uniref:4Fe-4S binding protein n=1 Tax=Clostridium sp. SHJSY1 TaxID=2942483 RepID=UPI002876BDDB|nr:4Fe-4S binding protein [Clostridium sp. SHJSY1]MDS0525178.1 4Fe-4S binding protein [Clostridium sp. SHJSY1]
MAKTKKKSWNEYLWIASTVYLFLGVFNILFAWIGLICFAIPLIISISGGGKTYCNSYCGRGQLFKLLGKEFKLSRNKPMPKFFRSKWFRYGFLVFFLIMFINMIFSTYLVFSGTNNMKEVVTLLWTWKMPWQWGDTSFVSPWIAQFAFGFYSVMLTSTILGIITMLLYKPRSWCVYCPMGTATQGISLIKYSVKNK